MYFYSTNNSELHVDLKTAVLRSLPADKGLYMPNKIPRLEPEFFKNLENKTFKEIGIEVSQSLLSDWLSSDEIKELVNTAISFPAPVVDLDKQTSILELFHGPSLAFKDFGARYMAKLMSILTKGDHNKLTILVATSGDTGGAVAAGFLNTPGINVHILYPSGKVSNLQEKQLTTLGHNIHAFEVNGTFDDCQSIVKQAFLDEDLNLKFNLSSANSINIARLIPQSFYYFEAYKQVLKKRLPVVFVVPSGNFGNLTAGIMAKKMGLPIKKFIAATNINHIVPDFLESGVYNPRPSQPTISNAMDVGSPSNFARMDNIYHSDLELFKKDLLGYWFNDNDTRKAMKEVFDKYNYVIDPHGAVGYLAYRRYQQDYGHAQVGIILETAHPSKFLDVVEPVLNTAVEIPERLANLRHLKKKSTKISKEFDEFKTWMLSNR